MDFTFISRETLSLYTDLYLIALLLDLVLGGPKGLGRLPGLHTAQIATLQFFNTARTPALKNKGVQALACLFILGISMTSGYGLDRLAQQMERGIGLYPVFALLLARSTGMKQLWSSLIKPKTHQNGDQVQGAIRQLILQLSFRHTGGLIAFLGLGFTGFLAYLCLLALDDQTLFTPTQSTQPARNNAFGAALASPFMAIAGLAGSVFIVLACLFRLRARWHRGLLALLKPSIALTTRPLLVFASSYGLSLMQTKTGGTILWVGPKNGRARLTPQDLKEALFVTLIAFFMMNGFAGLTLWILLKNAV